MPTRVAINGFGRIGREVASRARAFGMDSIAHDPFIASRAADQSSPPTFFTNGASRSIGIGNTIVVLLSFPSSVSVCM